MEERRGGQKLMEDQKYELVMGHLVAVVMIGMLVTLGIGFVIGNYIGVGASVIEKPAYCHVDKIGTKVQVTCNELSDVTLENLCQWASPELKNKVRLVVIN